MTLGEHVKPCHECGQPLAEVSVSAFGLCPSHGVAGAHFSAEPLRKLICNQSITSDEADEVWALIEAIEFNNPDAVAATRCIECRGDGWQIRPREGDRGVRCPACKGQPWNGPITSEETL